MRTVRETIGKYAVLWFWSGVLALLCTLISYPGIWYADSYVRVATGNAVLQAVIRTLKGQRMPLYTDNAFTVIPSFFMAVSQLLVGHTGLYTFAQAFAFFAAIFLLIRELSGAFRKLQYVLFALSPIVYGMAIYYEAGIGCVTGMISLILLFFRSGEEKCHRERVLELLLVSFASFVTFGYRTNALTVIPVLILFLLRLRIERVWRALLLLALAAGLLLTKAIPVIFDVHSQSTASVGIVWETLTIIQRLTPEERVNYQDYLDEIGGEGFTQTALTASTEDTAGSFTWNDVQSIQKLSSPGVTGSALQKYFQLMREHPQEWLLVREGTMRKALGIGYTLDDSEYDYNRWGAMGDFGFNDSLQRQVFYHSVVRMVRFFGFYTLHPWVPFLMSMAMLIIEKIRNCEKRKKYAFVFWMAVFYYLAYLLDTPAFDYRYFYPSMLLLLILNSAIAAEWIGIGWKKIRG